MDFPKRSSSPVSAAGRRAKARRSWHEAAAWSKPSTLKMGLAVGLPANRTVRGAKKSLTIRHRRSRDSSEFLAWLHSELLLAGCATWVMSPYASFHRCRIQDKG
jgi:hypothetical protein